MKTEQGKSELLNAKLNWRARMRKFFGKTWTKKTASKVHPDGRRHMNLPK